MRRESLSRATGERRAMNPNGALMSVPSVFGILYILAQAVERIVELVSDLSIWGDPASPDKAVLHRRTVRLWFVSSVIGVAVCLVYQVDFFAAIRIESDPWRQMLNRILSGIIVGSGTKPVHDVITRIEKYARA